MSKKDDVIETSGIVAEALPNAQFKVTLENQHTILAHLSGKNEGQNNISAEINGADK